MVKWHVWEVWDYSTLRPGRYTRQEAEAELAWWQEYYAGLPELQRPAFLQIRECSYGCRCGYKEAR